MSADVNKARKYFGGVRRKKGLNTMVVGNTARRRAGVLSVLLAAGLLTAACGGSGGGEAATTTCRGDFEATVHQGPNAGLELIGELEMNIEENGGVSGSLTRDDGPEVPVTGQAEGRAINLVFDAEEGQMFGVGAAEQELVACEGDFGGPLAGPESGDLGDWRAGYAIGG